MTATAFYDGARALKRELTGNQLAGLTDEDMRLLRAATEDRWKPEIVSAWSANEPITLNVALEIIGHEAIVLEAYLDSANVWTWSVGITNASGHQVYPRYKDNPQPLDKCLAVFLWALRERYVPDVLRTFDGHPLTEAQFAAALSFHYNTGAIATADWVEQWKAGEDRSRESIMNWRKPASIIPRREKERDLFFDGVWSNDGRAIVYPVKKPSYHPDFAHPERVDVRPVLEGLLT